MLSLADDFAELDETFDVARALDYPLPVTGRSPRPRLARPRRPPEGAVAARRAAERTAAAARVPLPRTPKREAETDAEWLTRTYARDPALLYSPTKRRKFLARAPRAAAR